MEMERKKGPRKRKITPWNPTSTHRGEKKKKAGPMGLKVYQGKNSETKLKKTSFPKRRKEKSSVVTHKTGKCVPRQCGEIIRLVPGSEARNTSAQRRKICAKGKKIRWIDYDKP